LLNSTATTLNVGGDATALNLGATTGTATISNPTLVGSAATQNLYNTTATTMNFAGAATSLNVGAATGTTTINNTTLALPNATDITGTAASVNVLNTATTVDAFKAATALTIAASTGTTTVRNDLDVNGKITIDNTDDTTSVSTGALQVAGGVAVAKDLFVGGGDVITDQTTFNLLDSTVTTMNFAGAATTLDMGAATGTATINNATVYLPNATNVAVGQTSITFANTVATTVEAFGAATTLNFADAASATTFRGTVTAANVLYANAAVIATDTGSGALRVTGGAGITGSLYVGVGTNTPTANVTSSTASSAYNSGALVVSGGAGIAGDVNVKGNVTINSESGASSFTVKGSTASTLIYTDAATNTVKIGGSDTTPISGATLTINGTDSFVVPVGTTAQRPGLSGQTDVTGMIRYNSTLNTLEFFNGTRWLGSSTEFTVITGDLFLGDGVTTAFTMANTATTASTIVAVNGVVQIPGVSYSVSGATLTMTEAPADGDEIDVRRLTTTFSVQEIGYGYNLFSADAGGAYIKTGTGSSTNRLSIAANGTATFANDVVINGNLWVKGDTNGNIQIGDSSSDSVVFNADINSGLIPNSDATFNLGSASQRWNALYTSKIVHDQAATSVSSTSATTIDTFATSAYTSAKYVVQVKDGSNVQVAEVLLVQNGTNAYVTTYGVVASGAEMGTFSATIAAGNVTLKYTSASSTNSSVKVQATYIV
jgi:hypothetical protein